jgi:hypothetical protein
VALPPEVVDVPGGHASLLQEPNVQRLAEAMNAHLLRTMRQDPPSGTVSATSSPSAPRNAAPSAPRQPVDIDA